MKKNIWKVILPVLLTVLVFCLCGCGSNEEKAKTDPAAGQENAGTVIMPAEKRDTADGCVLIITNTQGEPVSGVRVTVCDDRNCLPCTSGADGGVLFSGRPGRYYASILSAPAPYVFDKSVKYDIEIPGDVITVVLEQAAGQ